MGLNILKLKRFYRGDSDSLIDHFFIPCLKESTKYFRAVGFFTSQSLASSAMGLSIFLKKGGEMRFVASPLLTLEDIKAIETGIRLKEEAIEKAVMMQLDNIENELIRNRLGVLSWLISKEILTIKIAVPSDLKRAGIYHEKIGVFEDAQNRRVAFSGSANETYRGLVANFETIDVFCSFRTGDAERVDDKFTNFEKLWHNKTPNLEVWDFTDLSYETLRQYQQEIEPRSEYYFRHSENPDVQKNDKYKLENQNDLHFPPNFTLYEHQREALKNWFARCGKGILAMATGTGKTKTALSGAVKLYEGLNNLAIIIICPYKHLVVQWQAECRLFGMNPLLGFESRHKWLEDLNGKITAFNIGSIKTFVLITTNKTFQDSDMQALLRKLKKHTLIIADEMHNLGADKLRHALTPNITYRLGLSATPERHFDPWGTQKLYDYFGDVIYTYSLKEAIEKNTLTPYKYYPHLVQLTASESEQYHILSRKIGKLVKDRVDELSKDEVLKALLIKRARLIASAYNKIGCLRNLVKHNINSKYNLFYCGDGTVDSDITGYETRQIEAVIKMLGNDLNMTVHPFTAREDNRTRDRVIQQFTNGSLQGLVAIRCLDEGVDIPATQTAYILASSSNPKQFIQRRGRVLRKHAQKKYAVIHDFITVPYKNDVCLDDHTFNIERSLMKKELNRFVEFSELSLNEGEALNTIREIKRHYNLFDI